MDPEPGRCRTRLEVPAVQDDPLAHPDDAVPTAGRLSDIPLARAALVGHVDVERARVIPEADARTCTARVLERVRQRLLDDAIPGQLDTGVEPSLRTLDRQFDGQTGRPDLFDQLPEALETGKRRPGLLAAGRRVAEDPEHPAHVGQGCAAGSVDGLESAPCLVGTPIERTQARPCLDHDHAHMMRDDVMELARDPLPLVLDGTAGAVLAFGFLEPGVLLDRRRVSTAGSGPVAEGDHDPDGDHRGDGSGDRRLRAALADDHSEERDGDGEARPEPDAPFAAFDHGEESYECADALVDDLALDEGCVDGGGR